MKTVEETTMPSILQKHHWWEIEESLSNKLRRIILKALCETVDKEKKIDFSQIILEHPNVENYGDYSSNIALILSRRFRKKPIDIARNISEKINEYIRQHQSITYKSHNKSFSDVKIVVSDILEKSEVAGSGFLNLWLDRSYLITELVEVLDNKNNVAIRQILKGKKIAVEYTDPNPFKEFHLGHLYSNVIGESISRLFEACQATVWRGNFYGDVGMHVAKSVWGMMEKMKNEGKTLSELEKLSIGNRQRFLGQGYATGVTKYEEDKEIAEEIKDINYLIYVAAQEVLKREKDWKSLVNYRQYIIGKENKLKQIQQVYEAGLRWSLEYFETIYKRLGTKFDGYYPESWVGEYGIKLVEKGLKTGVMEKSDGSVVYRGEQDGFHTRVFVNKLGLPTYEAKDLGLAQAKYEDFQYDMSINVFGKEIDEYYKVVRAAMLKIVPELGKKANYIAHGMVKLPEGKMSSRTGNVITCEGLLNEAVNQALKIMTRVDVKDAERKAVADVVAIGAVRYALLKSSPMNDVIFDFEKSVSFEGDSGPYLLYTYARCRSVLRKGGSIVDSQLLKKLKLLKSLNEEEKRLLRTLYRFPEVVVEAAKTLSPNLICNFLFDLAQKYNLFYNKHSILQPTTYNLQLTTNFRLFLTRATSQFIKKGLYLLGIQTVERM